MKNFTTKDKPYAYDLEMYQQHENDLVDAARGVPSPGVPPRKVTIPMKDRRIRAARQQ